jgi:hypothetical protein
MAGAVPRGIMGVGNQAPSMRRADYLVLCGGAA